MYKNTYRIESARLPHWDYSNPGMYFVTICTQNFVEWFGVVNNEKMELNKMGEIAYEEWLKTGDMRKNIELDEFVIMPNHVHGIIGMRILNSSLNFKHKNNFHIVLTKYY